MRPKIRPLNCCPVCWLKQRLKPECQHSSHGLLLQGVQPLRPTQSQQDISISCCITITPPPLFFLLRAPQVAALGGESTWELRTLLPHFHLSHPIVYWPALAHSGGPVAVQQRHVTLGGQGSTTLTSPPTTTITHTFTTRPVHASYTDPCDPSSSTLHHPIHALPFAGAARAGPQWGGGRQVLRLWPSTSWDRLQWHSDRALSCAASPSPPIAALAIMPSMSNHFSIKIPTAYPLSSLLY